MGNLKDRKKYRATLLSIIMKAVYGIGFGIIGLTILVLIFLEVSARNELFSVEVYPNIELAIVTVYLLIIVGLIFFMPFRAVRKIKQRGQSILEATGKIKEQDLDFNICLSGVKEIDQILEGMDDMRLALKEALETQWRLEQNRKEQISALAHDFKTPITVLKGNLDLLKGNELDGICKEYVEDAIVSLKQVETYMSQLLEMTQAERGYVLNKQKIELGKVLDEAVSIIKRMADEKEISILTEKEKGNIFVSADRTLIERIFNNLISNALDFAPQKGNVKIILTTKESNAVVSITDSGCGFSLNALKHGTEQFYMEDTSRGRKNHHGLGLYIVDSIIKQHNGTIQLVNDELTGGARVVIQIPLIKEQ